MFGNPPDETAFFRLMLLREGVSGSMVMLQPSLLQYSLDAAHPIPVPLDIASVLPDRILLMDSYFMVAIEYGKTVAAWRKAGYQHAPEHASFKKLLETPGADALALLQVRWI